MSSFRILVVDDNKETAAMFAGGLRALGQIVQVSFNGSHSVMAAERFRPEVALLGLGHPDVSGFEICERIHAALQAGLVAVFAITG